MPSESRLDEVCTQSTGELLSDGRRLLSAGREPVDMENRDRGFVVLSSLVQSVAVL